MSFQSTSALGTILELPDQEHLDFDGLVQENERLQRKEGFLNRLLMAMTLLTRHRSLVSGDLDKALRDITRMAALSLEVQRASVWFFDTTRTALTCACIFDGLEGLHGVDHGLGHRGEGCDQTGRQRFERRGNVSGDQRSD